MYCGGVITLWTQCVTITCSIGYDDVFLCGAYYGYLCHVLDWWCCFVELNYCAFSIKLFSQILSGMNISSSMANLVIINTHWLYFYRCLVALEVQNNVRTWIHPQLLHHQIQLSWCKWWWKIRGCSLRPSTGWQIRVVVMHKGPAPNQYSSFKDFMDTKPPSFREAEEPLQAEEWLNMVEQKFRLLRLTKGLKAEYAAHQLQGPAGIWWNQYQEALPGNTVIDWISFMKPSRGISSLLVLWRWSMPSLCS